MDTARLDSPMPLLHPRLARLDSPMPLLHPRLARLDPALDPALRPSVPASRARLLAGTLGACVVLTFAAHAFPGPPATTSTTVAASRQVGEARASTRAEVLARHVTARAAGRSQPL